MANDPGESLSDLWKSIEERTEERRTQRAAEELAADREAEAARAVQVHQMILDNAKQDARCPCLNCRVMDLP